MNIVKEHSHLWIYPKSVHDLIHFLSTSNNPILLYHFITVLLIIFLQFFYLFLDKKIQTRLNMSGLHHNPFLFFYLIASLFCTVSAALLLKDLI